ncbi:hypothetical protein B0T21DRAFT_395904 [Apiosordaria backusii]|uniref:Hsp70 family chaperone n=1 Tax=Apiosordaria backusii TaxID=314023 RepID=A0AA40ANF4_9PEZI|nr:hypothetical protein B0T21DRAFT_395904 [Apiosordaria backusii]
MSNSNADSQADICVAVDFGTTFTGVAWAKPKENFSTRVIHDWPGGAGNETECKVPSVIARHLDTQGIRKWGYECEEDIDETNKWRYLKTFLVPAQHERSKRDGHSWAPQTMKEVHELVTEYLKQVYLHVKKSILRELGKDDDDDKIEEMQWNDLSVDFVFSVPTTWEGQGILNDFKAIIQNAQFGLPAKHNVMLGLTEAEAAAVAHMGLATSPFDIRNGDVFLSIDAGGGTTDLAFVKAITTNPPVMEQIQAVSGIGIGSQLIDFGFQRLVSERLKSDPEICSQLPKNLPLMVCQGHFFRKRKHRFGEANDPASYTIPVWGVQQHFRHDGLGIEGGQLIVKREELEAMFQDQLQKILALLGQALDRFMLLRNRFPVVRYVILSGGLGSSAYILDGIKNYIKNSERSVLKGTQVRKCPDPQLVVVKGLLCEQRDGILRTRIARASYGLVVSPLYSKKDPSHFQQKVNPDPHDGKKYVENQIRWMVKRDEEIPNDPKHVFSVSVNRRADLDGPFRWTETIVVSSRERTYLPTNTKDANVSELCKIPVDLSNVDRSLLTLGKPKGVLKSKFYVCQYDVCMAVGASGDMRFEVRHEGQPVARSAEPVRVRIEPEWNTTPKEGQSDSQKRAR